MKNIAFLILCLFFAGSALAQKIRFTDAGNTWRTLAFLSDGPPVQVEFTYGADTLAFGHIYRSLHKTMSYYYCRATFAGGPCPGTGGSSGDAAYLVREDTVENMVYYRRHPALSADTIEHILYNYNLLAGDSVSVVSGSSDSVVNIDSTIINGVYHKIFNFENRLSVPARSYTVVEGIGCTNSPMFPAYLFACFEYGESLSCFSQSGYRPAAHAPIRSCANFTTVCCSIVLDRFDNPLNCATVSGISPVAPQEEIIITPNPAATYVNITASGQLLQSTTVSFYQATGKCVFHQEIDNNLCVNTSLWPNGVYIILVRSNSAILKRQLITITK